MIAVIDHLNLEMTGNSGQCFRWKPVAGSDGQSYEIIYKGHYLLITHIKENEFELSCTCAQYEEIWKWYFDLSTDYSAIEESVYNYKEPHLIECFEAGWGIRILRQDLWEMIISYLISQNNNIKRISNSIEAICKKAGYATFENPDAYRFPGPDEVTADFFDDPSLGLGYRVPYLKEMFSFAKANPDWLEKLSSMDYGDAYLNLLSHLGIGPKVANCICLFGLHHTNSFPIDTHVKQLLDKYYQGSFDTESFKETAGIIQQYLFYFELKNK